MNHKQNLKLILYGMDLLEFSGTSEELGGSATNEVRLVII